MPSYIDQVAEIVHGAGTALISAGYDEIEMRQIELHICDDVTKALGETKAELGKTEIAPDELFFLIRDAINNVLPSTKDGKLPTVQEFERSPLFGIRREMFGALEEWRKLHVNVRREGDNRPPEEAIREFRPGKQN